MEAKAVIPQLPSERGQLIDIGEVRARLRQNKNPTTIDLVQALEIEREQVDRLTVRVLDLEHAQDKNSKHFTTNVAEVAKPIAVQAANATKRQVTRLQAVLAVVLLVVCLLMYFSFKSVYNSMNTVSDYAATKASWQAFSILEAELATKASKADLKVIEAKADRSVVERLARELRDNDGTHDSRLNDLATDIMSKANKQDVDKLSSRLQATRNKVRTLEKRMKEISAPATTVEVDGRPKTM